MHTVINWQEFVMCVIVIVIDIYSYHIRTV